MRIRINMNYLITILDLVAGLLLAIHLWVPKGLRGKWDKYLIIKLNPEDAPVDAKTIKGSIIITTIVVIIIMTWGYFVEINQGTFTSQELWSFTALVLAGVPIATILLFSVMLLHQKIKLEKKIPLVLFITVFSLIVLPLISYLLTITNGLIDRIIIGFLFSFSFMTLLIQSLPVARRFLTFESGVLARLGVTLFVISKIIQITNL